MLSLMQECESPVVKATAHADAMSCGIKGNQRCKHQVECAGFYQVALYRFGNPEAFALGFKIVVVIFQCDIGRHAVINMRDKGALLNQRG